MLSPSLSRYRFALRPRWILSHLLVVALVVTMVNLGFWQLRRLDDRRDFNRLVRDRTAAPIDRIDDVVDPDAPFDDTGDVTYRRARATGTYDADREVMVWGRSLSGEPGVWILTPLITADGAALVVNRGWVPARGTPDRVPDEVVAPPGEHTVEGLVLASQKRGRYGPKDPPDGVLATLARADIGRLQQQVPYDLYPVYLQLQVSTPPAGDDLPRPLPAPELSEGPHLGYAGQWFTFSAIAVVGYPLILRRNARERERASAASEGL
ncbi:MAG: SURF1 family cytochrome oxidase biogenesis protein [Acidimicrobiales bacterium]